MKSILKESVNQYATEIIYGAPSSEAEEGIRKRFIIQPNGKDSLQVTFK